MENGSGMLGDSNLTISPNFNTQGSVMTACVLDTSVRNDNPIVLLASH
jgi:hypothetical protein